MLEFYFVTCALVAAQSSDGKLMTTVELGTVNLRDLSVLLNSGCFRYMNLLATFVSLIFIYMAACRFLLFVIYVISCNLCSA